MRALVYLTNATEWPYWQKVPGVEVILAVKDFSRRGTLTWEEAQIFRTKAQAQNVKCFFEWDALMEEPRFRELSARLEREPFLFDALRVRDAGAIRWAREHLSCELHLLLEAGHHNQMAMVAWQKRLGARLKRLVLSPEIPLQVIRQWRTQFDCELELLGLGPLLLFHSPRALLRGLASAPKNTEELFATGASEESPHKGFPLQENQHGTLMFHPKDISLLERWEEMEEAGIDWIRVDHRQQRHPQTVSLIRAFLERPKAQELWALKTIWEREWMRGYWSVNKSAVLFDKLKNPHLAFDEEQCGEILEVKREAWLAVLVSGAGLRLGEEVIVINPHGEKKTITLKWLKDDQFNPVTELKAQAVGMIPWCSGMTSKSRVLRR